MEALTSSVYSGWLVPLKAADRALQKEAARSARELPLDLFFPSVRNSVSPSQRF
jgi:hypothetical protein